jgi:hypothetical protein
VRVSFCFSQEQIEAGVDRLEQAMAHLPQPVSA